MSDDDEPKHMIPKMLGMAFMFAVFCGYSLRHSFGAFGILCACGVLVHVLAIVVYIGNGNYEEDRAKRKGTLRPRSRSR